jgi:hypothetical protein
MKRRKNQHWDEGTKFGVQKMDSMEKRELSGGASPSNMHE